MKPEQSKWFDLDNADAYASWRERKLACYPASIQQLTVEIADGQNLSQHEHMCLQSRLDRYNMAIYRTPDVSANKAIALNIGSAFGLQNLDNNLGAGSDTVTEIKVNAKGVHGRYIPYTSKKLSWHTDGYYNIPGKVVRSLVLHCVRPAANGGESSLLDPEMAYIYLRDLNPGFIRALSLSDAMTIPANIVDGITIREAQTGPVFSLDSKGYLHMRFSARKRNIKWKPLPEVAQAVRALENLFKSNEPWVLHGQLQAGEGLICNNVLHKRQAFQDDASCPRLLYRMRYYERVLTNVGKLMEPNG